jgi:hypothetical protein
MWGLCQAISDKYIALQCFFLQLGFHVGRIWGVVQSISRMYISLLNNDLGVLQLGLHVGRIWGFSLGSGTGVGPMGQTVVDKTQILETAPGVRPFLSPQEEGSSIIGISKMRKSDGQHLWQ